MDKNISNIVIGGLVLLVLTLGWLTWSNARQVRDYRNALEEANAIIDQSRVEIEDAQAEEDEADFGELHSLIENLSLPETVSDPHPAE